MSREKLLENQDLIDANRFAKHNHVTLTDYEENSCEGYLDVEDDVTNVYGMVHGGAFYALADVTAGMTARGTGRAFVTQAADLHYLSTTKEKRIFAKSAVLKQGRNTSVIESRVTDSTGKLLFLATFTFYCVEGRVSIQK